MCPSLRDARGGITLREMASAFAGRRAVWPVRFSDRAAAGLLLGECLRLAIGNSSHPERTVVTALPRGGVAVGAGVARCLGVPLEVLVTRKIGHPDEPEVGLGTIAEGGEPVFALGLLEEVRLRPDDLAGIGAVERAELARRVAVYLGGLPPPDFTDRHVIVVDDGLATGVTARAALRAVHAGAPALVTLAVPVAPAVTVEAMKAETGGVVTLVTPRRFRSVGEWYAEFGQLTDSDVLTLLAALR